MDEDLEESQNDTEGGLFYDLDVDNLGHAFELSQDSIHGYCEGESDTGEAVDWNDIEAWAEQPDDWPDDDDDDGDTFYEIDSSWALLGHDDNGDSQHENEKQGGADWQDIEDGQLEAALSAFGDSQHEPESLWYEDEQYMDVDEMGLFHMGVEDGGGYEADEGRVWQWQDEHEMMEHIL